MLFDEGEQPRACVVFYSLLATSYSLPYFPGFAGALTGAECVPSSTECDPVVRTNRTTSAIDVHMKITADHVVRRVSTFAAARGPKAVCEPWPKPGPSKTCRQS